MAIRLGVVVLAMLTVAGCAPMNHSSNSGYAYGGELRPGYDDDTGPIFRPSRTVTCDRTRKVCYDRFGLDYYATARHFGDREANRSVKKYGEQVLLFSPKRGVTCDRRSRSCSDKKGPSVTLTQTYFGRAAARDLDGDLGHVTPGYPRYMRAPERASE